jgi:hypothetical protein
MDVYGKRSISKHTQLEARTISMAIFKPWPLYKELSVSTGGAQSQYERCGGKSPSHEADWSKYGLKKTVP